MKSSCLMITKRRVKEVVHIRGKAISNDALKALSVAVENMLFRAIANAGALKKILPIHIG